MFAGCWLQVYLRSKNFFNLNADETTFQIIGWHIIRCKVLLSIDYNIIYIKEDVYLRTQISRIYWSVISFSSQRPEKSRSFNMVLFCPFFFILVVNPCWAAFAEHGTHLFQNEKSQSSAKDTDMDKGGRSK